MWDPATNTVDEANKIDSFLDPNDPCPEETAEKERVATHVLHGKTRCWSSIDSARSVYNLRKANNTYFNAHPDEAQKNLTATEYIELRQVVAVGTQIADVERFLEGAFCSLLRFAPPAHAPRRSLARLLARSRARARARTHARTLARSRSLILFLLNVVKRSLARARARSRRSPATSPRRHVEVLRLRC